VTIFGQSAGASSVFALLTTPLAAGLFQRAIGQSGSGFAALGPRPTFAEAQERGLQFAASRGAASLAELRALPPQALLGDSRVDYWNARFGPVAEGWFLPEPAGVRMARGQFHDVSLMTGGTANEATPMLEDTGAVRAAEFREAARQRYGARADEFLALYPAETDEEAVSAWVAARTDQFVVGTRRWARAHVAHSARPAYVYHFDRRPPGRNSEFYGAWHSSELYYCFGTLGSTDRPWEEADRRLAEAMTSYWTNFAARGDPNGPGLPTWPAYDPQQDLLMELGERIGPLAAPNAARMAFQLRELERTLA
jgi:para-nitrobenzyl esterase